MLTDTKIRAAKPADKAYKLYDSIGLFILVSPSGSKLWRFRYSFRGKQGGIALGKYPYVSLAKARKRRDDAKTQLADGIDPAAARRAEKNALGNTFEAVAIEYFEKHGGKVDRGRIEKHAIPYIGREPIAQLTAPLLLECLRRIEKKGFLDTAHRVRSACGRIFRYAIATGRAERDIASDLRGALPQAKVTGLPFVEKPQEVGALLRAIDGYMSNPTNDLALRLAPYVFVRPGELRAAEWADIEGDVWRIPAEKMKMKEPHIVPLSRQAQEVIEELRPLSGRGRYLFPNVRSANRCMSENSINAILRRLGYTKEQMCGHGFRKIASTLLHELNFDPLWIEAQLAHKLPGIAGIYNKAIYLPQRVSMMQSWADYLDQLRDGAAVIAIGGSSCA